MATQNVWKSLVLLDEVEANVIIETAFRSYWKDIYNIAADIYDSCIEDYYGQYIPTKYDRHGDLSGFNLYRANNIEYDEDQIIIFPDFAPEKLLKYDVPKTEKGKYKEKRYKVLKTVISGLRGAGSYKNDLGSWPQEWYTSYPNNYSQYNFWSSNKVILNDIYKDFMDNVLKDTKYLLEEHIEKML